MDWIKRNLFFVIGTLVAIVLLGGAGFYFYSAWKSNSEVLDKLHEQYAELDKLRNENPHPGIPPKSDNIKLAKEQQEQLRQFKDKARQTFQRIPGIPEGPKVVVEDFITSLRHTIDQLQKVATNSSIALPADYSFSFAAQKGKMTFATNSLDPLSVQLGEVKAICDVLFQAKINALDYVHRERITAEDASGLADYVNQKSVTNDLAVLTPYEVKFRCFTPELAAALTGFANSPHGLLVKTINVDLAPAVEAPAELTSVTPTYVMPQPTYQPATPQLPMKGGGRSSSESAAFRQRYGLDRRPTPAPTPSPVVPVAPAATQSRGGLQTVLDEKQLTVTLALTVVKLQPAK